MHSPFQFNFFSCFTLPELKYFSTWVANKAIFNLLRGFEVINTTFVCIIYKLFFFALTFYILQLKLLATKCMVRHSAHVALFFFSFVRNLKNYFIGRLWTEFPKLLLWFQCFDSDDRTSIQLIIIILFSVLCLPLFIS